MPNARDKRKGFALGSSVGLLVVGAWFWSLQLTGPETRQTISNIGLALSALTAGAACMFVASRADDLQRRWVWRFLSFACVSWGLGQCTWTAYESVLGQEPFPSLADVGYVGFPILVCVALFRLGVAPRTVVARLRALLDGIMIASSLFLISWILVLGKVVAGGGETRLAEAISITYPVGDVVVVTLVLYVVLRLRQLGRRLPLPLGLVATGLVAFSVADSGFAYLTLTENYHSGSAIDLGWFVGFALVALAALRERLAGGEPAVEAGEHRPLGQLVPYIALAAALGVTSIESVSNGLHGVVAWGWGFIVLTLMVRQVLALLENLSLTRHLEARVTERTRELEASERRFRALVQRSSDVVTVIDDGGTVTYQSDSVESIFGYRPDQLVGRPIAELTDVESAALLLEAIQRSKDDPTNVRVVELEVLDANGQRRVAEMTLTNLLEDPAVGGMVLNARDVSERRALEQRLVHDAFHDALTGLPNRNLFSDRLGQALHRRSQRPDVAILFIDLDGFKRVNDTAGHLTGDELLGVVASRLVECVRPGDTVARLGGDEFAVLLEDVGGDFGAVSVAERVCATLKGPVQVETHELFLQGSVGIAVAESGETPERLLRNADLAMYRAKAAGSGSFALYDPRMHSSLVERVKLETDLRRAIEEEQFVNYYQPTFDIATGRLQGFEALVRWEHPERGLIPPGAFIPTAEETGLIREIGRRVLRDACHRGAEWVRVHPELEGMSMSVNISGVELSDSAVVRHVTESLLDSGLPPSCLVLEITESTLIGHSEETLEILGQLKDLGVRLAIDDFGTGYSSLSYLHRFPVDILKIDRSFIERLTGGSDDAEFVRTIVKLGASLSLATVAEGVETKEQLDALRLTGCGLGQGFSFSPPLPAESVSDQLVDWIGPALVAVPVPTDSPG